MGYKVKFDNGYSVTFDKEPSQADIDEAFAALPQAEPKKKAPVAEKEPSMLDFLMGAPRKGHSQDPTAAALQTGAQKSLAVPENAAMIATGGVGQLLAPVPAALKKINSPLSTDFEQEFANAINTMTYEPKISDDSKEMAGGIGEFMNRNVVPLSGMVGMAPAVAAIAATGKRAGGKVAPKRGLDVVAAASEMDRSGEPQLGTRRTGAQGELFPDTSVTEKIGSKDNTVIPGAASEFDPFQEQSAIQPRSSRRQMDLPFAPEGTTSYLEPVKTKKGIRLEEREAPVNGPTDVIRQDRRGVGTRGDENSGLVEAVRRGAPEDVRVFEEMQQQLRAGEKDPVDTTLPRGDAIGDMVNDIRARENQRAFDERQAALEQDVARQQSLDFNAAERQRQGDAPVLGLEEAKARAADEARAKEMAALEEQQKAAKSQEEAAAIEKQKAQLEAQQAIIERQKQMEADIASRVQKERDNAGSTPVSELMRKDKEAADLRDLETRIKEQAQKDPLVQRMADKVSKMEELVIKLAGEVEAGTKPAAMLKRMERDLAVLEERLATLTRGTENRLRDQQMPRTKSVPTGFGKRQGGWIGGNGKKRPGTALATRLGIDKVLQELAPALHTVEQAKEVAMGMKDVDKNMLQKAISTLTKGGLYEGLKTHNPIVRFAYDKFALADRLGRAAVRDIVHGKLAPAMQAVKTALQGDIWMLMEKADLMEKDLDLNQLARNGATPEQLKLVETHRSVMSQVYDAANRIRASMGMPPITKRVAYAAMRASGDYRRQVFDKEGGNFVGVVGSNYRWQTEKLKKQLEEKGLFVGEEKYFGGGRNRRDANNEFMHAIEVLAQNDPRIQQFVDVLHNIRQDEVYSFMNAKTHFMPKKGVFGMQGRKPWETAERNALEGFQMQLNYAETILRWSHLAEAAKETGRLLNDPDIKMPNAKKWAQDYMMNALGFNPSKIGTAAETMVAELFRDTGVGYSVIRHGMGAARTYVNTALLALNPRFWTANIVQPLIAMPSTKAYLVSRGLDANFDFGTGYRYIADGGMTALKADKFPGKLSDFEKAAVDYAHKHHVFGSDMVEHSNRPRKGIGTAFDAVTNTVTGSIENGTRRMMFYAFAHMLERNGMKLQDGLFTAAHNLTDMTMNNYSTQERPQIYNMMGPVGDVASNLQSYKHNELSRLALFARQISEAKGTDKIAASKPLAVALTTGILASGVTGMVAFSEMDWIVRQLTQLAGKPTSLSELVIQASEKVPGAPYLFSHGIFSLAGIDMSKSLGLQDIVPNSAGELGFPGGSKLYDTAEGAVNFAKKPTEMNAKRMAYQAAPPLAQKWMYDQWFTTQKDDPRGPLGINPKHKPVRGEARLNDTDRLVKKFGFQGINEAVQKQKTWDIETKARAYTDMRQNTLHAMSDEMYSNNMKVNPETVAKYIDQQGNPETLVGDLERYAIQMQTSPRELAMLRATISDAVGAQWKAREYLRMYRNQK